MTEQQIQAKIREERNNYQRQWRAKNKDKVRAINARYWAKRARQKIEKEAQDEQKETD